MKNRKKVAAGRKGGLAGKGKSKVRGNSEHYRNLVRIRDAKRRAKLKAELMLFYNLKR